MYKNIIKRLIDLAGSFIIISLLSPVILIITVILLFANNGKPFFFQLRPGKNEILFKIIKFKTMNDKRDQNGELLPNNQRITSIGKWLRKYSLDEIPQLFNVFIGNMSLVGPRPLLIEYLDLYSPEQAKRHLVKPGITGWAQVNGRNMITWEQKFAKDIFYVENISLSLDIKILWLTLIKVIKGSDVNYSNDETMPKFEGNKTVKSTTDMVNT